MNCYKINITIILSYIFVILSYINEINIKNNDKIADFFVLSLRFMHYFVIINLMFYAFIYDKSFDCIYLFYVFLLFIKWLLFKDCILTYLEKKFYHNDVIPDDIIYKNYYMYYIFFDYEKIIGNILLLIGIISFFIILYRMNISYDIKEKIIIFFFYIIYKLRKLKGFILNNIK